MQTEPDRTAMVKVAIESTLNGLATFVFPAVLVVLSVLALVWQIVHSNAGTGTELPIKVWEQPSQTTEPSHASVIATISLKEPVLTFATKLSTHNFWFTVNLPTDTQAESFALEFPSRHATNLTCWDGKSDQLLGRATRSDKEGLLVNSRAGFSLESSSLRGTPNLLCRGAFRGPAKISVSGWNSKMLTQAKNRHEQTATLLEAGIGILTLTMLITALINRSWLYWTFVGWLILNMRMAALSAGSDFTFFGYSLSLDALIESRKWTVCLYFSMTVALFGLLFKEELKAVKADISLTLLQLVALLAPLMCFFVSFETTLQWIWLLVSIGAGIGFLNLYRILHSARSRVAVWYAAAIVITLLASVNEVVTASLGIQFLSVELNSVTGALGAALLVTAAVAEHMRADRLEKLEARRVLRAAYEDSPIGLFSATPAGKILNTNPAFRKMVQSPSLVDVVHISDFFDERVSHDLASLEGSRSRAVELQTRVHDAKRASDRWYAIKASTTDGKIVEGSLQDVTERYAATERLEFLANHDPLTECLNLRGIARTFSRTAKQPTALAYFDLDRFKLINDLYGHTAGDKVLKQVCERMQAVIGTGGVLSRVGGDEFVIAFIDLTVAQVTVLCESIIAAVSTDFYQIGRQRFTLKVSAGLVGTARFRDSPLKEIISAADTLCRMAKKRSDQRLLVMESDDKFFRYHKDELEILTHLERGEPPSGLFLVMQPEISLTQPFDSLNFEILLRMRKLDGEIVPAGVIIEAAEMHGKTAIIDRWVVTTAIAWIEAHLGELTHTRFISINLSGGSLNDESFTEELFSLFEQHPDALALMCIEITESVALTDISHVQRFINRVRTLGGKVAIDDFGAGYSSFGYLRSLSVDALKLDGSLVKDATQSTAGLAIIDAIGGLVSNLGMKSIGEYAEDLPTIKALVNAKIDYAQGYGISKPVMPEQILAAKSSADFIEDSAVLAFLTQLQAREDRTLSLFSSLEDGLIH